MLRVGQIPYLNCEPFYAHLTGVTLTPLTPRALGAAMAEGTIDAGPCPLADCLRLEEKITRLPFGIATRGPAQSVFLLSNRPMAELNGALIGTTDETSTSIQLLRLLLTLKYEVTPRAFVGLDTLADATLLIGDQALKALKTGARYPHRIDLGTEWVEWTGLPCVFACWAIRSVLPESARAALRETVSTALERGMASLQEIAARRRDTGLTEAEVINYLNSFVFRFGPEEEKAIAEFRRLLRFLSNP